MNQTIGVMIALLLLTSGVSLGCGEPGGSKIEELENEGQAFLRPGDLDPSERDCALEAGEVQVEVIFDSCASSTCTELQEAECQATRNGDEIVVTSSARIERATGPVSCSDDCIILSAFCDAGTVEEGTYTLSHGSEETTVEVPSEDTPCF